MLGFSFDDYLELTKLVLLNKFKFFFNLLLARTTFRPLWLCSGERGELQPVLIIGVGPNESYLESPSMISF
jgi:hypothetical protein